MYDIIFIGHVMCDVMCISDYHNSEMHYNSPEFVPVPQPVPSKLKKFPPKFNDFNPGLGS